MTELQLAGRAYVDGRVDEASTRIEEIIGRAGNSLEGLAARYLRARGIEDGFFGGSPDLQAALLDFEVIAAHADIYGSDGLQGQARVLYKIGNREDVPTVIRLAEDAVRLDNNFKAMMLLGLVNENILMDEVTARRWYLRAFVRGLPWGIRYYARSHIAGGNYLRGALAHALASVVSPVIVAVRGIRSPIT